MMVVDAAPTPGSPPPDSPPESPHAPGRPQLSDSTRDAEPCGTAVDEYPVASASRHAPLPSGVDGGGDEDDIDAMLIRVVGIKGSCKEFVQFCLEQRACPDVVDLSVDSGISVLSKAAAHGHSDAVMLLLDAGASVNFLPPGETRGRTALCYACLHGHADVVRALLSADAHLQMATSDGGDVVSFATALHYAVSSSTTACMNVLLAARADPDATGVGPSGGIPAPPVYTSAMQGNAEGVRLLLHARANVSDSRAHLMGPLELCDSQQATLECTELLVGEDEKLLASGDTRTLADYTKLLSLCCERGLTYAAALLLDAGVPPDRVQTIVDGSTYSSPLTSACRMRNHGCVKVLLDAGSNPAATLPDGQSAMACAKANKDTQCLRLLIEALRRGQDLKGCTVQVVGPHWSKHAFYLRTGVVISFDSAEGLCKVAAANSTPSPPASRACRPRGRPAP